LSLNVFIHDLSLMEATQSSEVTAVGASPGAQCRAADRELKTLE
jgi:hypothetical protein